MICVLNSNTDPFFNTASEEYLLKQFETDCFMLWQNTESVFIGKHQNALAEINYKFIELNNIPVIRRLSGGGTVFHDLGNLNFSFITKAEKGKSIEFKTYLKPISEFISSLGIEVEIGPRNNLFIKENKISGTAAHIYKDKVIHHGTLLFNSSKENLLKAIDVPASKYSDKAVKSVKSPVTNISEHLSKSIPINNFIISLNSYIKDFFDSKADHRFNEDEITEINKLSANKYQTWEWNFGYSPSYSFHNKIIINSYEIEIKLEVRKGIIETVVILGNQNFEQIKRVILNLPHRKSTLFENLHKNGFDVWCEYLF